MQAYPFPPEPDLFPWDVGPDVAELQELLRAHGFPLRIDGDFGWKTEAAVKSYQHQQQLRVDGVVGAKTWNSLKTTVQPCTRPLKPGRSGMDVMELQGLLQVHGYQVIRDGLFNAQTLEAVVAFQQRYHLHDNGLVDAITWTALRGKPLPDTATHPKPKSSGRWW